MRDFKAEEAANNQAVAKAEDKITRQEALVASLAAYDPRRREAENVLHQMRHNAGATDFLRSLSRYDDQGE